VQEEVKRISQNFQYSNAKIESVWWLVVEIKCIYKGFALILIVLCHMNI